MIIKCLGGLSDGLQVDVPLSDRGEPPETVLTGPEEAPELYELHRCNDPLSEGWWWAYIVHGKYESTQAEIESTRPVAP